MPAGDTTRMIAVTDDVNLRPWEHEDADAVLAIYRDPDVARWDYLLPMADLVQAHQWIERRIVGWEDASIASWAIATHGRIVGSATLRHLDLAATPFPPLHATISYHLLPAGRGRGTATRTAIAVAQWLHDTRGLHRVELHHDVRNAASCAVAERAGYALEGTLRQAQRVRDGWTDEHLHARVHP